MRFNNPGVMAACMLLACALTTVEARAADAAAAADALLSKGITAFGLGQVEAAKQALQEAMTATKDPGLLARIQLYMGLNLAVGGSREQAMAAFRAALEHDPSLRVDANNVKPDLVQLFDEVRGKRPGSLRVSLTGQGARVLVDGKDRGPPPLETSLEVGEHTVEVRSIDGLSSSRSRITIRPGQRSQIAALLQRRKGRLQVRTAPPGADVMVDGQPLGQTPLDQEVEAGARVVSVELAGHAPQLARVVVAPDERSRVSLELKPLELRPARRRDNWFSRRLWTWVAAGTAVAALGAGIGVGVSSNADFAEHETTCKDYHTRCDELADRVQTKDRVANAMFGVAGAAAAAALVLYFVEDRRSPAQEGSARAGATRLRPLLGGLAGGVLSVSF